MTRLVRLMLIIFSFSLSVFAILFLLMLLNNSVLSGIILLMTQISERSSWQLAASLVAIFILAMSMMMLVYSIMSGRLRKTRIRETETGVIDIGVDAIESIALNSAKSAQCGIKTAKARVAPFKGDKISVQLTTILYSDVEVPAMMAKVQERIKKDIERYRGIPVAEVQVMVSRVEAVAARVEH